MTKITSIDHVASYSSVDTAWRRIWTGTRAKSKDTEGIDGLCLNDFSVNPKPRIKIISSALLNRSYQFSNLKPHLVEKPNGKKRLICVPTVNDRIVQRALLNFLNVQYGARFKNAISYGFIQERTVSEAAKTACMLRQKNNWAFKTDISAFFDNVDRQQLSQKIKSVIRHRSLHKLLLAAVSCEIEPPKSKANKKHIAALGIENGKGIRQGMPLSPFFANLFLESFDNEIINAGYSAIRYADDLIFFAESHERCIEIESFCRDSLKKLNLEIPVLGEGSKSSIASPHEMIEFLGLGLQPIRGSYELILTDTQRKSIYSELMHLSSIKELLARNKKFADLGRTITSRIAGYHSAYGSYVTNYAEFQKDLEDIHQKILRAIYGKDGLGIDLKSLSQEKRTFLGIL